MRSSRPGWCTAVIVLVAWAAAARAVDPRPLTAVTGGGQPATAPDAGGPSPRPAAPLEFVRVHADTASVQDLPLEKGRYVPMPVAEFEAAVAAADATDSGRLRPTATLAEYDLAFDGPDRLAGRLVFELDTRGLGRRIAFPLGAVSAQRCSFHTDAGSGEAVVFGLPNGEVAVETAGSGRYACEIEIPVAEPGRLLRIPLPPALVTSLRLALQPGLRPIVLGPAADAALVEPPAADDDRWEIVVADGRELVLAIWDERRAPPPVACWNRVSILGRQASVAARVVPVAGWTATVLPLQIDGGVVVTSVHADDGRPLDWTHRDGTLRIEIPARLAGGVAGIIARGMAPVDAEHRTELPGLRPLGGRWAGCGLEVTTDGGLAVEAVELTHCLAIAPADASSWPLPPAAGAGRESADMPHAPGGRLFLEHQSPAATAAVLVRPRSATIDTARVTTIDLSPGTVLGRTACDMRVVAGEVYAFTAKVAAGWFIDAVEAVDWQRGPSPTERTTADSGIEWRVVPGGDGNELRIALAVAATPTRGLGLRITGHRAGVPLGGVFSTAELDMVRLPGEAAEEALLEFKVGPLTVLEAETEPLGIEPATGRLAALAGEAAVRARVRAGDRAPAVTARLVRRRPPVDAEIRVGLVARDERLAETFGFTCRPVAGELDAVVVHFSEPMTSALEWSLIEPATGSIAARRLDPAEAAIGGSPPGDGVAESWLVDVRPATAAATRFTATRTVPLPGPVALPLAWVEAAEQPGGVVTIRGEGGQRPELVNRRLRELPSLAERADGDDPATIELAYGSPASLARGDGPAAELLPAGAASGSRAWAWRETTTCRCHDSGMLEWESRLDVENQGRGLVHLTVPAGLRLEQVSLAGVPVSAAELGQSAGMLAVPLPASRGRVSLVMRGTGRRDARLGWWTLGAVSCGVDLPILDRTTRLFLPPGLGLAGGRDHAGRDWAARLFDATAIPALTALSSPDDSTQAAAAGIDITASTRGGVAAVVIVRRRLLHTLAILGGSAAAVMTWWLARRRGVAAVIVCAAAGVAALWCQSPWDVSLRPLWWGCIIGTWAAAWLGPRGFGAAAVRSLATVILVAVGLPGHAAAAAAGAEGDGVPLRVIISDDPVGGVALVPEQLFRRLAVAEAEAGFAAVRVLTAAVEIGAEDEPWRVSLDVAADRGGVLSLEAAEEGGGTWLAGAEETAGVGPVTVERVGEGLRLVSAAGGRGRLELRYRPAFRRDGAVEAAVMPLPPAAAATLVGLPADPSSGSGWQCDRADAGGPWLPAPKVTEGRDISRASQVRVVRPLGAVDALLTQPRTAESGNDVAWRSNECRVDATFVIGGEREIVRQLVVRADPGLEPAPGSAGLIPLGEGRHLLDLAEPMPGRRTVTVSFRMPVADPVGLFELPGVWLEEVRNDQRTVRLRPEPGLEVTPELPLGLARVRPRPEDGPATTAIWRSDVAAVGGDASQASEASGPRPRIAVRRRPLPVRGSQSLVVDVARNQIGLRLDAELEAVTLPLVEVPIELTAGVIVDRVTVTRRSDPGEAVSSVPVDAVASHPSDDRLVVVFQRPDTGLFHLRIDARVPGPPAIEGRLPLVRAALMENLPLAVTCRAADGLGLAYPDRTESLGIDLREEWFEIPAGDPGPPYALSTEEELPRSEPAIESEAPAVAVNVGVPLAEVHLAIDHRGRGWGLVRFDLVAAEPDLLLTLPVGMRLFDIRCDGREVTALPKSESTWEVRLHDVTWPRTLVAVFAGTVGGPLADGKPIRLEPPSILGLPSESVLWSLEPPAGFLLRVSEPARRLDPVAWNSLVADGRGWLGDAFEAAVAAAEPRQAAWLEEFAGLREAGRAPVGEQSWSLAWSGDTEAAEQTLLDAGSDGVITVRPVPVPDPTAAGRGLATMLVAGLSLLIWTGGSRIQAAGWRAVARWWWLGCGLAWLLMLTPALPGLVMLAWGGWVASRPVAASESASPT